MTSFELKFLAKRYRRRVAGLLLARAELAFQRGREAGKIEEAKRRDGILDNSAVLMTIQRLGDANAQIASQLAAALAKNLQSR